MTRQEETPQNQPSQLSHFADRPTPWWSVGVSPAHDRIFTPSTHSISCLDTVEADCVLRSASSAYQRREPSTCFSSIRRRFVPLGRAIALLLCSLCSRRAAPPPPPFSLVVCDDVLPGLRRIAGVVDAPTNPDRSHPPLGLPNSDDVFLLEERWTMMG